MVHEYSATAAYMCQGQTSFAIDADPTHNHWASSMKDGRVGQNIVTVPTVNIIQMLQENVTPQDWVMLKVDIEGAEYDLLPCLANSEKASLVDRMYLEEHTWFQTGSKNGPNEMKAAK